MNTTPGFAYLERVFRNELVPMPPTIRKLVLLYIKELRRRRALKAARTRRRRAGSR